MPGPARARAHAHDGDAGTPPGPRNRRAAWAASSGHVETGLRLGTGLGVAVAAALSGTAEAPEPRPQRVDCPSSATSRARRRPLRAAWQRPHVKGRRQSCDSARNIGRSLALSIVGTIRFHQPRRDADRIEWDSDSWLTTVTGARKSGYGTSAGCGAGRWPR